MESNETRLDQVRVKSRQYKSEPRLDNRGPAQTILTIREKEKHLHIELGALTALPTKLPCTGSLPRNFVHRDCVAKPSYWRMSFVKYTYLGTC